MTVSDLVDGFLLDRAGSKWQDRPSKIALVLMRLVISTKLWKPAKIPEPDEACETNYQATFRRQQLQNN
jgi:hypothetical protein